jgi:hypothetical protein
MGVPRVFDLAPEAIAAAEAKMKLAQAGRECGECNACCTVTAVYELNKPTGVSCCHLAERCTIYETRPLSCRAFACNWLLRRDPAQADELRPDRLGLMFTNMATRLGGVLVAWEVWPDARSSESCQRILAELLKQKGVIGLMALAPPSAPSGGLELRAAPYVSPADLKDLAAAILELQSPAASAAPTP